MQSCHAKRFINIANFRWDTCCDNMLLNAKNTVLFHGCITTRHSCIIPCTYNTVIIACQLHILWVDWGKEKRMYHGEGSGISKNNIHMLISLYIIMCVVLRIIVRKFMYRLYFQYIIQSFPAWNHKPFLNKRLFCRNNTFELLANKCALKKQLGGS